MSSGRRYDPALGARPLRRTIQRLVEDPLSEKLLWKEFTAGQMVVVDAENGEIAFRSLDTTVYYPADVAQDHGRLMLTEAAP